MGFAIERCDGGGLRKLESRLDPVYRQCFSTPPWSETAEELAGYPVRLARHSGYPGAYGFVAFDGDEVAGAVYGWPAPVLLPAGNEFDVAVRDAVPAETAMLLVAPAVVVAEVMVAEAYRRRGLARDLLARFVAGRPRAWLATHPEAEAVALYEREGWVRRISYAVGTLPLVLFTWEAPEGR